MTDISTIFDIAMSLMDELSAEGESQSKDTLEYEHRTPRIMNILTAEYMVLVGDASSWAFAEGMDDMTPATQNYAVTVMPYGLAANLLIDENPTAASFFQQRYEELRSVYLAKSAATISDIENVYGGNEYSQFSRWG